jgi:hypothetical protein
MVTAGIVLVPIFTISAAFASRRQAAPAVEPHLAASDPAAPISRKIPIAFAKVMCLAPADH